MSKNIRLLPMTVWRLSINWAIQADGAPFADRGMTVVEYSDGTERRGKCLMFVPPWKLRLETLFRWRTNRACFGLAVAWLGRRHRPEHGRRRSGNRSCSVAGAELIAMQQEGRL